MHHAIADGACMRAASREEESRTMKFGYTIIYVSDVPAVLRLYNAAFGISTRFLHESNHYGELETGATALAFASHVVAESGIPGGYTRLDAPGKPAGAEVGFVTADVDATYSRAITAGAAPIAPPKLKPWGQRVAYVRSLEGTLVELCTPMNE